MKPATKTNRLRLIGAVLVAGVGCGSNGCATPGHRTTPDRRFNPVAARDGASEPCRCTNGEAARRLLGIVPRAMARVIDFSARTWRRRVDRTRTVGNRIPDPATPDGRSRRTRPQTVSTSLLFTPGTARR